MPFSCKGSSYVCQSQSWVARPRWNTSHPHCKQNGPLCGGRVSSRCSPARASLFRRYTFQQWKHDAAGIKPTTLLYSHEPIPMVFIGNEQHELTKPTVQLIGRNQSGANRAAQAKECPEGMSHSLALAFWHRIQIRLRGLDLTGELQFPQLAHESQHVCQRGRRQDHAARLPTRMTRAVDCMPAASTDSKGRAKECICMYMNMCTCVNVYMCTCVLVCMYMGSCVHVHCICDVYLYACMSQCLVVPPSPPHGDGPYMYM